MQKSKMIELLSNFSAKELTKLGEFIASPYFNKDEEVILFYNFIRPLGADFSSKKVDKDYLLKNGIKGISLTEKKLSYLMNYVVEYAEAYIQIAQFQLQKTENQIQLLKKYNYWGADKFFERTLTKIQNSPELHTIKDTDYWLNQYHIASESTYYFDRLKIRSFDPSLQEAADYLDLFYISTKLKYLCELMNRQQLVAANYEMRLLHEIFAHVQEKKYEEIPAVSIYYQILMLFQEPDNDEHYQKLKNHLVKSIDAFSSSEARDIFTYAQNYCITKANAGKQEYLAELLLLYKISLDKKFIIQNDNISPWAFKNIVSVATRVGEINWAENFVKMYINYVNTKFKDNAYNYNLAYLYYSKKEFGNALQMLNAVEYTDVFYALDSRILQIKLYYEMDEVSPLLSSLDSFRVYLRRNKIISEHIRIVYSNFIKFTDKLIKYSNDKPRLAKLKEDIIKTKQVADINWLLLKLQCNVFFFLSL